MVHKKTGPSDARQGGRLGISFTWKSLRHLREKGIVAFLLPAMGLLHNHAKEAIAACKRLLTDARIRRMINLSDLRFQLFEKATRPIALLI